jgi:uncharacterized protein involved in exopolysaccharide biosynthesis
MTRRVEPASFWYFLGRALLEHKGKVLGVFLLILGAGALAIWLWPRAYVSQAKLLVRLGRENVTLDPTATLGQASVVAVPPSRENDINSVIEVIHSRVLLEKVVDALGPGAIFGEEPPAADWAHAPGPDAKARRYRAVRQLERRLSVEAVKRSNVIAVSYEGPSAELAQAVVTKLVDLSLDYHLQLNRTPRAPQFLAEQASRMRKELARAEVELKDLKNRLGLVFPDGQRQALVTRIGRLEDEAQQTASALAAAEATVRLLKEKLAELPTTTVTGHTKGFPNQATDAMRALCYSLQVKRAELLAKYPAQNPEVQELTRQIAAAKEELAREEGSRDQVTTGPSRLYEETRLALLKEEPVVVGLKAKAEAVRVQLEKEREAFKAFNDSQLAVEQKQRVVSLHEALYRKYAENVEQAQIDQALTLERISNISIMQPATYELKPARPKLALSLALAFAAALLGSVAVGLTATYLAPAPESRPPMAPQTRAPQEDGTGVAAVNRVS